ELLPQEPAAPPGNGRGPHWLLLQVIPAETGVHRRDPEHAAALALLPVRGPVVGGCGLQARAVEAVVADVPRHVGVEMAKGALPLRVGILAPVPVPAPDEVSRVAPPRVEERDETIRQVGRHVVSRVVAVEAPDLNDGAAAVVKVPGVPRDPGID